MACLLSRDILVGLSVPLHILSITSILDQIQVLLKVAVFLHIYGVIAYSAYSWTLIAYCILVDRMLRNFEGSRPAIYGSDWKFCGLLHLWSSAGHLSGSVCEHGGPGHVDWICHSKLGTGQLTHACTHSLTPSLHETMYVYWYTT